MSKKINGYKVGAIKRAVENHIHPSNSRSDFIIVYSNWYIGITNNTKLRKAQHEREKDMKAIFFSFWDADTKSNAAAVEDYFHDLGMLNKKGTRGAVESSKFVYIFKHNKNLLDLITMLFKEL